MNQDSTYFLSQSHYQAWKTKQDEQSLRAEIKQLTKRIEQLEKQVAALINTQQTSAPRADIVEVVPPEPEQQEAKSVPTPKERHTLKKGVGFCSVEQKQTVTKIVFESFLPDKTQSVHDISEAQDGNILSWVDAENVLHIGSEGIICANPDSSDLFQDYGNVTEIDFGTNFDTSCVTDMSFMFAGCASLQALDLSGFETSLVTNMSGTFLCCQSLEELDVSGFDTSSVTNMNSMFGGCRSLTKLDVSGFDTSNVTDMSFMFHSFFRLKELNVSNFNTSSVTNMSFMFASCVSLQELDVSGFDMSRVRRKDSMFSNCDSLSEDSKAQIRALGIKMR